MPRHFTWIIRDRLAVSERPGGYSPNHRRVRRQEELTWLQANGFTVIVSLLASDHNLHAYEEAGLETAHHPFPSSAEPREVLATLYPLLRQRVAESECLLVHQEELNDRVLGVVSGYLCWARLVPEPPQAVAIVEQMARRQLGSEGRRLVAEVAELAPPAPLRRPTRAGARREIAAPWLAALIAPQPNEPEPGLTEPGLQNRP
jgi:hypothetical protein